MAANTFISYFQNKADKIKFDYKLFNDEHLVQLSPTKLKIDYLEKEEKTAYQFRDAIISNLGLNDCFYKDIHNIKMFDYIYKLVKETEDGVKTDDQLAQLTLSLHFSKSFIQDKSTWDFIFEILPSLTVINDSNFDFKTDLVHLFNRLKSSERITQRIKSAVMSIIGSKEICFNFENLTLKFYNFADYRLNGFAGVYGLFIGINSIERFLRDLPSKYDCKQRWEIFSLNMTRLITHEICHVVLRRALNDFNASSPCFCPDQSSSIQSSQFKMIEAGVIAEKELFSERINWRLSVMRPNFDLDYCTDFLNQLIYLPINDQYPANLPHFDFERSGCVLNTSKINYMAVDIEEEMEYL